ncbi:MAG: sulfite exporter TauE/SafE family protein [Leptonema sp. (in: bacteria)]
MKIDLSFFSIIALISLGTFTGIIGSVLGIGGGIFIIPFLIFFFKLPLKYAIAVSLVSIVAVSSSVAMVNIEKGLTNLRLGITLEIPMALGSLMGSLIMLKMPSKTLQLYFGIILLPIAFQMFYKSIKQKKEINTNTSGAYSYFEPSIKKNIYYDIKNLPYAMVFSFFGGTLSGLFGLGGGIIQVPIMNFICGVPMKIATSTSNFMIGLSATVSAIVLLKNGYVLENIAAFLIIGVIVGSFLGIRVLYKSKSHFIQILFSIFTLLVSFKMIWESIQNGFKF